MGLAASSRRLGKFRTQGVGQIVGLRKHEGHAVYRLASAPVKPRRLESLISSSVVCVHIEKKGESPLRRGAAAHHEAGWKETRQPAGECALRRLCETLY